MRPNYCSKQIRLNSLAMLIAAAGTVQIATAGAAEPAPVADWLKASGYVAASYIYKDVKGGRSSESVFDAGTPFDAAKLGLEATKGAFSAYSSIFYSPITSNKNAFAGGSEAGILDAYASYTAGSIKVTAGKYLSYIGYEAFDASNMTQMSYANTNTGGVPAYHTGIKIDYSTDVFGAGFNISDSVRGPSFWEGDSDFSNGLGYEAYVTYKGIDKLTLWFGGAYDETEKLDAFYTLDLWASYSLTDKLTLAAELIYAENTLTSTSSESAVGGLALLSYAFTDQFSTVFRFGFDEVDGVPSDTLKYTISPTYAFTEQFLMRAEISHTDMNNDELFTGIQALVKF